MTTFLLNLLLPPWLTYRRPMISSDSQQPSRKSLGLSLQAYSTPGVFPPSARIDPKLKRHPRRPLHLWEYWKYPAFLLSKATDLTTDVLCHQIWGPRKKSWGIEMTIATSLVRGTGRHTGLVDIGTIRMLMNIGGLVPLPSDALATPVTFRVKKRQLRGILAPFDASETGSRELSGEWVVSKKTWQRLQSEWKSSPKNPAERSLFPRKERVILYIHGGAYYLSSAAAQRMVSIPLAKHADVRLFAIDYRLAPETQFPGPLHDVVSAYFRLVEDLHVPPENIILSGDSAGGGLALALLMYLRDNDYPLPSGAMLMSPWVDLTLSCESWDSNAMYDVISFPVMDSHMNPIALYLGEHAEKYLTHPYASPLFGTFEGLPPLLIQAGDAEVLRDEIALLAHKASLAGVLVRHEVYDDAVHVFQAWPCLSVTCKAFESMRNFVHNVLPKYQVHSPQFLGDTVEKGMEAEIENERAVVVGRDGVEMRDGNVKHKFSNELDLFDDLCPSPVPAPLDENEGDDGYWEVEDVWEEDNWLRGDGEDGMEFLSCKRGVTNPRELSSLENVSHGTDASAKGNLLSLQISLGSFSSPNTPGTAESQRQHADGPKGYFFGISGPLRRAKSTTSIINLLGKNIDSAISVSSKPHTLTSLFHLSASSLSTPPSEPGPLTPPSSPNIHIDSSLASRLYALPSYVLASSNGGKGGIDELAALKSRIKLRVS